MGENRDVGIFALIRGVWLIELPRCRTVNQSFNSLLEGIARGFMGVQPFARPQQYPNTLCGQKWRRQGVRRNCNVFIPSVTTSLMNKS